MSLPDRVLDDLRAQRQLLLDEFAEWRQRADGGGDLTQHQSQVKRTIDTLSGVLRGALASGPLRLDGDGTDQATLDTIVGLRHVLGTVHLLWDFFRDKFAQRDTGLFADHLGAADDLAWHCYETFLKAAVKAAEAAAAAGAPNVLSPEKLKEPPLLFYSPDRSPFAQARVSSFQPPGLSAKDIDTFRKALLRLPVPIIGFPWPQARSVPALVFVGHEVGHVIAEDLGLAAQFPGLIDSLGLPADRAAVWRAWADETFADIFGVLVTGSAYVDRLMRLLAADRPGVRNQPINRQKPGNYPTRALRIALCQHVQLRLGLEIDGTWEATYDPPSGDSFAFAPDVDAVVEALLKGPYPQLGGLGLDDVLPWTTGDDDDARNVAKEILKKSPAQISFAVRPWIAAAVHAQASNPVRYAELGLDVEFADQIVAARQDGVRSAAGETLRQRLFALSAQDAPLMRGAPIAEDALPSLSELDRQAGLELATFLTS